VRAWRPAPFRAYTRAASTTHPPRTVGYGVARVPTSPGAHALEVATWRPLGSAAQELSAFFLGGVPHLSDPGAMLLEAGSRHSIGTVTTALVLVELQVLVRGFAAQGVALEAA